MKKIVVGYHGYCMDGLGSLAAVICRFGKENVLPVALYHNKKEESFQELVGVIEQNTGNIASFCILDFSFDFDMLAELEDIASELHCGFLIIDHHSGAKELFAQLEVYVDSPGTKVVYDTSKSGALLTHEYYRGNSNNAMLAYISDADTWKWKLPYSRDVNALLVYLTGRTDVEPLLELYDKTQEELITLATEDMAWVKGYMDATIDLYVQQHKKLTLDINGESVSVILVPCDLSFCSLIGERYNLTHPEIQVVILYTGVGHIVSCSCRSNSSGNSGNALKVSQYFNGNGQPDAAGFRLHRRDFYNLFLK